MNSRLILGEGYLWSYNGREVSLWEKWPPGGQRAEDDGEYVLLSLPVGIWREDFGKVRLIIEKIDE